MSLAESAVERYCSLMLLKKPHRNRKPPRALLESWYQSSASGRRLRVQASEDMSLILDEWFGYHILVIGVDAGFDIKSMTRVQHLSTILPATSRSVKDKSSILACDEQLPIATESVDVVVLLNALELSEEPHRVLREVHRILTPHGHLLLVSSNPLSLRGIWGALTGLFRSKRGPANNGLSASKLHDWLTLLNFSVAPVRHKLWLPFSASGRLGGVIERLDNWLAEHNIPPGSAYVMFANKMVQGHISGIKSERVKARLMGLPVAKPVVGARGSTAPRSRGDHLRPVD